MKTKVLIIAAVLLMLAAVIMPAAAAQKTVVTKKVYRAEATISFAVGTVTYDTADGSWTFTQSPKVTLPGSSSDGYYLGITTSRPVRGVVEGSDSVSGILPEPVDGTITASGVADPLIINPDLANGGVFILYTGYH